MTTTTTQKGPGTRRTKGAAQGNRRDAQRAGGSVPRQLGVANTTERRAVMVGHTVRILADYDGLQGHYAKVLSSGGGQVEVDVHLYGKLEPRRVIFLERELVVVPMNDALRDTGKAMVIDGEVYGMIRRCTDLRMVARHGGVSALVAERLERRAKRLHDEVRCLQRARSVREAHRFVTVLGTPCCYALVVVGEGRAVA
jgi:hypothetical protein